MVNDELGGQPLVMVTIGWLGSRAYQRGDRTFAMEEGNAAEAVILTDDEGQLWRVAEDALVKLANPTERLPRIPSHNAYWFGWYSFYPNTELYREGE